MNNKSIATDCVHAGNYKSQGEQGVCTPIFTSSSYFYQEDKKNVYPRYFNIPNQLAVAKKLSVIEKGEDALVFSSGIAAISSTLLALLKPGDHALFQEDIYGGTLHFVLSDLANMGIKCDFFNVKEIAGLTAKVKKNTRLVYFESPSNPLLNIVDLKEIVNFAKKQQLISVIDNTFATPINQKPLIWGVDIVLHSGTKYLSGHSDMICGAVITNKTFIEKIKKTAINLGGNADAYTCYMLERSIKTLSLRVERQSENAIKIAEFLASNQKINQVNYPGIESHPQHQLAARQMKQFGGMLSFEVDIDPMSFIKRLQIIQHALSLGGVESLISIPVKTSHALLTLKQRKQRGIHDNLLRLSVGIEDVEDIIEDLKQALSQ